VSAAAGVVCGHVIGVLVIYPQLQSTKPWLRHFIQFEEYLQDGNVPDEGIPTQQHDIIDAAVAPSPL
jgi:hypothetical protein